MVPSLIYNFSTVLNVYAQCNQNNLAVFLSKDVLREHYEFSFHTVILVNLKPFLILVTI